MDLPIYVVAWTGGFEPTQFAAVFTEEEAREKAADWDEGSSQNPDDGDMIEVFKISRNEHNPLLLDLEGVEL